MKSVSPETTALPTRKHCEPGVWPGVWSSFTLSCPMVTSSPPSTAWTSESESPVSRCTNGSSALWMTTFAGTRATSSAAPITLLPMNEPPRWSGWKWVTRSCVMR